MFKNGKWVNTKYIVNHEKRFVYFAVPKVASSSIKELLMLEFSLEAAENRIHKAFDHSEHQINKATFLRDYDTYRPYFKFAFVRNPWDRLVSCWAEKIASGRGFNSSKYGGVPVEPNMTFPDFAHAVCRIPDESSNVHFRSQHVVVCENEKLLADFVGRQETLSEDFAAVAAELDLDSSLGHRLRSKRESYRDYYDNELAEMVGERYETDARLFKYKF